MAEKKISYGAGSGGQWSKDGWGEGSAYLGAFESAFPIAT